MTAKKLHFFQKPLKPLKILAIKATAYAVAPFFALCSSLYLLFFHIFCFYLFPFKTIKYLYSAHYFTFYHKTKDLIRMSKLYETHPIYHVNPKVRFKISKAYLQNFEHSSRYRFRSPRFQTLRACLYSFLILS